jgi:hypothetical protein
MRIEVTDSETAHAAASRLKDDGFVAYVPSRRLRKNRHFVLVATSGHERVAGFAAQRAFELVREVDPAARPMDGGRVFPRRA